MGGVEEEAGKGQLMEDRRTDPALAFEGRVSLAERDAPPYAY
jgi:hypothetical protein